MEEILETLKEIKQDLEYLKYQKSFPRFLKVLEIVKEYHIKPATVRKICKEYGTDFGGLGIEETVLKKYLQGKGIELLK